jgi:poly(beta-D-mannuronate) lyase
MNGIPNGPIAGYDQVERAIVAFNTIVNCRQSIVIGYASSTRSEATAAPRDSAFANNIVVSSRGSLVRTMTLPSGLTSSGNLFFGAVSGLRDDPGVKIADPKLVLATDGLWRPAAGSPALAAATGEPAFVTTDIDGQLRAGRRDIGCDQQSSAPVAYHLLTAADVGPDWMRH